MKATGVRYLQFIPCLDPLGAQRGIENYSLSPELYAQFFCAPCLTHGIVTGKQVSMSVFACLKIIYSCSWAHRRELAPPPARAVLTWLWRAVALFTRAIFTVWTSTNSERFKMTLYNRCFWGEKMRIFIKDGRNVPAECQQCRWVNLCHGGCKRDRNTADKAQRSYYCKALQKFLPTLNPECVKWPVRCRCTAEKETDSIGQEK